jgi:hypothetical protein
MHPCLSFRFWGFYLGRSPQSRMDAVTVQKPSWPDPLPSIKWKPYPNISPATHVSVPSSLLCRQWIGLYEIMLPLTDILSVSLLNIQVRGPKPLMDVSRYGCSEISKHALQQLTATTVDRLRSWRVDLSPELGIDKAYSSQSPLPHVLILQ